MAVVAGLSYYPVKGCAGTAASEAALTPAGLAHDRSFMVVSEEGGYRTQRRDPRLALIRPEITRDGSRLTLRTEPHGHVEHGLMEHGLVEHGHMGHSPIKVGTEVAGEVDIEVDTTGERRPVDLFGTPYTGIDQGDAAAEWLSEVLGTPSRLVRVPPEHDRATDGVTPGTSGYADSSALHLISLATVDLLNGKIVERGGEPLPMDRFRPNIVVAGWDEPHTEDRAHHLTIGTTELGYTKAAIRCAVTLVDQTAGHRTGPEPLRTLATYRRAPQGGVALGTKYAVLRTGKLSVGDEVTVSTWGTPEVP
ncbi:MOSC domain-containing protein [Streptomyces sp. p1417]|uniref:MOSC domain-containing protein n=1 Tax=Streptomyces typhae TaxID=2681492 RepID=A0A6L6X714_9ACTN|nr:MOSC N-terminal beta barrel domain-containing protein [Streptomyces typhae]MVO89360.1 MOSC domain-containing protein [Streptomyces typhae]